MHLIRRSAFRAASSPSTSFISQSRSINTSTPFLLRSKVQATGISPSVFKRFASDDSSSPSSADGESSSVSSAIDSATESASTYASEAAESASSYASEAAEKVSNASEHITDAAAGTAAAAGLAFQPREDRRESRPYERNNNYGDRNGGDRNFTGNGNGPRAYGGGRYGGGRSFGDRAPRGAPIVSPTPSIYVGNLLFDITAADLQREFGQFGEVKSAIIASDPRGMSKGFGYVEFETIEQATAAIEAKHQSVYEGRRLVVNYQSRTRREDRTNPPSKTLFIGNLAFEMSDSDLNKLFRDIRNVIDVRVAIDRRTGQPRGFAHADFVDVESAVKGMETLRGQEIYGRVLRVDYSLGNRERNFEGGNGGDRGGQSSF